MTPFRRFLIFAALAALAAPATSFAWASKSLHSARAAVGIPAASASALPTNSSATHKSPGLQLPVAPPRLVDAQHASYGYQSINQLSATVAAGASASTDAGPGTVTVTAIVLPVHTIIVHHGAILSIYSNTPDSSAASSLWVGRADTIDGATLVLDAQLWAQVRARLAHTRAGIGKIA